MHFLRTARADVVSGALVLALGCFVTWEAARYPIGSPNQMGPGFFPLGLGVLLAILGVMLILEGRRGVTVSEELSKSPLSLRAVLAVPASLVAFSAILPRFGLIPATFALVLLMALGDPEIRPVKALIAAAALSLVALVIFVGAFDMALAPFRWGRG